MSRGLQNNNPGNIRLSTDGFLGEIDGSDFLFKTFVSIAYGYRAMFVLLSSYIRNGYNTIARIISRWAPSSENNTESYINSVVSMTGIDRNKVLTFDSGTDLIRIVAAMSFVENGVAANMDDVIAGFNLQDSIKKK